MNPDDLPPDCPTWCRVVFIVLTLACGVPLAVLFAFDGLAIASFMTVGATLGILAGCCPFEDKQ